MRSPSRLFALPVMLVLLIAAALTLSTTSAQPRPRQTPAGTFEIPAAQVTPPARPSYTPAFTGEQAAATATAFAGALSGDAAAVEATAQALASQFDLSAIEGYSAEELEAYLTDLLGESAVAYDSATGALSATIGVTEPQWTEVLTTVVVDTGLASSAYIDLLADYGARVTLDGIDFEGISGSMQVLVAVDLVEGQPLIRIDAASFNGRDLPAAAIAELNAQLAALNLYDAIVAQLMGVSPTSSMPYAYVITALLITGDASYVTAVIDTGLALPTPAATPAIPRRRG